jgi:hypothetical protein
MKQKSTWNRLVAIISDISLPAQTRIDARMYLDQLNTAGGKELTESEAKLFLERIEQSLKPPKS